MSKKPGTTTARNADAERVIVSLLGAADAARRHLAEAVEDRGLTLQQYNVLRILRGAAPEPVPTMEVGARMIEKTPGVTRFLDRLEARGLVRRERSDEDRRLVHAWITDDGLSLLGELDAPVAAADRTVIAGLTTEETDRLVAALERVRGNVR